MASDLYVSRRAEERGGYPAEAAPTGARDAPGILRIGFPGYGEDDALHEIPPDGRSPTDGLRAAKSVIIQ